VRHVSSWVRVKDTALTGPWVAAAPTAIAPTAEELYSLFRTDIFAYVSARISQRQDAEDITAEVFVTAMESWASASHRYEPRLWLLGVARRKVADFLRRRKRHPEVLQCDLGAVTMPGAAASAETDMLRNENRRLTRAVLHTLKDDQREALLLKYIEGLTVSEISVVLRRSPAAVNSLLQRARAAFARQACSLSPEDGEDLE
jgi:RNA polymerase sigma-70 factor, ECF subfamily